MARAFQRFVTTCDRVSSVLLGRDGSVRNIRGQLDDQQRALEHIAVLGRRLATASAPEMRHAA